jgi:hypothetical protein
MAILCDIQKCFIWHQPFHCDRLCADTLFVLLIIDGYLWDYEIVIKIHI